MSYLQLSNISKHFDEYVAVDNISLSVEKGEFISLLGPSGCGKTTTLQMVAGFLNPTAGSIVLDGKNITAMKPSERGLGIVFQKYALFPHMTVLENVAFGLEMRKVGKNERLQRAREALELVHLGLFIERYPRQLSGGQQQRVALARALVINPHLLLLDEPLSNLDAKLREDMQLELHDIQRRVGTTTIMVTHDQSEALAVSDRIAVMQSGRIEQIDKPFNVYEHPKSDFVSSFLGKTNTFEGRVSHGRLQVGGQHIAVDDLKLADSSNTRFALRPEKIRFCSDAPKISGKVSNRVFLGSQWIYEVQTPLGDFLIYESNNQKHDEIQEGETVGLSWDSQDMRLIAEEPASHV
ncbi:ABC transporter ATP-binding protein [Marinobacterium lutimaris]|uniref:Putative spermidine/putrescine transport system ATP-binding protein n=1 Tax=Marinobacterium lutimaris TaxID=568106 RepID=A0A1H5TQV9_9GAMM|nr:ABC transporter ATP-binding protein [Marinobacterium lutimaris]SEF65140.1 putative spermidine/putrescine transport system ATP-binding protein [Marinobacterium lutimaris]